MISGSLLPLLLVCGLFALILAVGIGCSYLWLVWLGKEATKCPKCGQRGAGELRESEVIESRSYTEWERRLRVLGGDADQRRRVQVTEQTFEDHFECERCKHRWTTTARQKTRDAIDGTKRR